jgi:serine/threonine protein kinase
MLGEATPRSIENSEEARAFLQQRVSLFWKVMCLLMVFASVLAIAGAVKRPGGPDLILDVGLAAQAGAFWWLCRRGARSIRFLQVAEAVGLFLFFTGSSFLGRFVLVEFARERMAPESITAPDSVDARVDIYGLGAVAYYLIAGGEAFSGGSIVEICSRHLHETPEPFAVRGVTVSPELEAVVRACLEKKPRDRPQSAVELRRRLEACSVQPWGSDEARAWWLEHQRTLEGDATSSVSGPRTIAVGDRSLARAD